MNIYTLNYANSKYFKHILPPARRRLIRSREVVTLGAFAEGIPAGALQFYIDHGGSAVILYFSVFEGMDREEIGTGLLLYLENILRDSGARGCRIRIFGRDRVEKWSRTLIKSGFEQEYTEGIFRAPLRFWLECPDDIRKRKEKRKIHPLSDLSKTEKRELFREVFGESVPVAAAVDNAEEYENTFSCYISEPDVKACLLIVRHVDRTLEVLRFGMKGNVPAALLRCGEERDKASEIRLS